MSKSIDIFWGLFTQISNFEEGKRYTGGQHLKIVKQEDLDKIGLKNIILNQSVGQSTGQSLDQSNQLSSPNQSFVFDFKLASPDNEEVDNDQIFFSKGCIWIGKKSKLFDTYKSNFKSHYFLINNDENSIEQYYQLYIKSLLHRNSSFGNSQKFSKHTTFSLFGQQLCYSIPQSISCLTIDTDVYIPDINNVLDDHQFLFKFLRILQQCFKKYLRFLIQYQKYSIPENHEVFDFIVTARQSIDDINNPSHPPKTGIDGRKYYRYGYHTYFYNLQLTGDTKSELYKQLQRDKSIVDFQQELQKKYAGTTTLNEYLDQGPFKGTSSLAFSCGNDNSIYKYIIVQQPQDPNQDSNQDPTLGSQNNLTERSSQSILSGFTSLVSTRINSPVESSKSNDSQINLKILSHEKYPEEFHKEFLKLNPFKGCTNIPIVLFKDAKKQSIVDFLSNSLYGVNNYQSSILTVNQTIETDYQNNDNIKWLYNNVILQFSHPNWQFREAIIICLYVITNKNIFYTELFYYIIMCENPMSIINDPSLINFAEKDNFILNFQRDRYPQLLHKKVSLTIEQKGNTQYSLNEAMLQIIDVFNSYIDFSEKQGKIICPKITSNPFSLYGQFNEYFRNYANSVFGKGITSLEPDNADHLFRQFLFEKIFKNIKCVKTNAAKKSEEYVLYKFNDDENSRTDYNHYQELNEQLFLAEIYCKYKQLIEEFSLIVKNAQSKEDQEEGSDSKNSDYAQKMKRLQYFMKQSGKLNSSKASNFIISTLSADRITVEPNKLEMVIGVYNGILKYEPEKGNFRMMTREECIDAFQIQSALFKIQGCFLNENDYLISEEEFLNSDRDDIKRYQIAYRKIENIFEGIFGEDQIEVFWWKVSMILFQILSHKTANEHLVIEYGTGGDGKSINGEAIQLALGISSIANDQIVYVLPNQDREFRKISNYGYTASAKASVLATEDLQANSHDTGGIVELEKAYYGNFSELSVNAALSTSTIKKLACNTQIVARRAYAKDQVSFFNKAFLTLQLNNYPKINQSIDSGIKRRLLFYQYPHKFVTKQQYDEAPEDQKKILRIKNVDLQDIFKQDIFVLDAFGLYMCYAFIKMQKLTIKKIQQQIEKEKQEVQQKKRECVSTMIKLNEFGFTNYMIRPYIPKILQEQTELFFADVDQYYPLFLQSKIIMQDDFDKMQQEKKTIEEQSNEDSLCVPDDEVQTNIQNEVQKETILVLSYTSLSTLIDNFISETIGISSKGKQYLDFRERILFQFLNQFVSKTVVFSVQHQLFITADLNKIVSQSRQMKTYKIFFYGIGTVAEKIRLKDAKEYLKVLDIHNNKLKEMQNQKK